MIANNHKAREGGAPSEPVKLFEPDLKSTSYKIPIIKLVTSLLIITACMFRGSIFHVENKLLIFIFSFAAVALVISCILIVYISCCEIFATFENKFV